MAGWSILGHHYQRDEVIRHADFTGDCFKLAQSAADRQEADFIVFCGVHFMAESADILSGRPPDRVPARPERGLHHGRHGRDRAGGGRWEDVTAAVGEDVLPVTYMNSTAALKAFVGRHGGAVCTSSNARAVLEWAFARSRGCSSSPTSTWAATRATAWASRLRRCRVRTPTSRWGSHRAQRMREARVLLWKGHCSVHNRFTPDMVDKRRAEIPGVKVIVHPECRFEVAQKADVIGSTEGILKTVRESPPGTKWTVGTELNMVTRMAREQSRPRASR